MQVFSQHRDNLASNVIFTYNICKQWPKFSFENYLSKIYGLWLSNVCNILNNLEQFQQSLYLAVFLFSNSII